MNDVCDRITPENVCDRMAADLVEWNVMGDPRPYVLICQECSAG